MDPVKVPQRTMPISERLTVKPTRNQCGPYMLDIECHAAILIKPMEPRMVPSNNPATISRRITRHQSFKRTSPRARARMMSVAA